MATAQNSAAGNSAAKNNAAIIEKFRTGPKDTGSPEVQIALLTNRIEQLTGHVAKHPMDRSTNRGMLALISRRKNLLGYLKGESPDRYRKVIASLGLRK